MGYKSILNQWIFNVIWGINYKLLPSPSGASSPHGEGWLSLDDACFPLSVNTKKKMVTKKYISYNNFWNFKVFLSNVEWNYRWLPFSAEE